MTLLVFGKTGQVATELARLNPDAIFLDRDAADLLDSKACADVIHKLNPTAVINAAAFTAVDNAELDEDNATRINGETPGAIARACAELDIPFVHISTDYVFDGSGNAAFKPDDLTAPLGAYGRSKLVGEQAVATAGGRFVILRTSWVFSAHGNNFVKSMLRLSDTREQLNVVADQIGGPTAARPIAQACLTLVELLLKDSSVASVYHFAGAPNVSWADFAREIFSQTNRSVEVVDIPSSEFPTRAKRPANSRMDCTGLSGLGISRPDWHEDLATVLIDLGVKT